MRKLVAPLGDTRLITDSKHGCRLTTLSLSYISDCTWHRGETTHNNLAIVIIVGLMLTMENIGFSATPFSFVICLVKLSRLLFCDSKKIHHFSFIIISS